MKPEHEFTDDRKSLKKQNPSFGTAGLLPGSRRTIYYEPLFPVETILFPRLQAPEQAVSMAQQCILCESPAPCMEACPLHIDIPAALKLMQNRQFSEAGHAFARDNPLAEITGRLCPHDQLCQAACNRVCGEDAPQIGLLEEFAAFQLRGKDPVRINHDASSGRSVAVVGSGPAGLTCAHRLLLHGYQVTIFERMPSPGGMLRYGMPEHKVPPGWVDEFSEKLERAGVVFNTGIHIGVDRTVEDLLAEGFASVFLAAGCGIDNIPDIPGVDLPGVYKSSQFIALARRKQENLSPELSLMPEIGHRILVLGGSSTAIDCLQAALHIGAEEATCLFHRTENEMTVSEEQLKDAREAGAHFRYLTRPLRFIPDPQGRLSALECLQCELGPPDVNGLRMSVPIPGSNFLLRSDTVVLALGVHPDPTLGNTTSGLKTHSGGLIAVDPPHGATSVPGVFAGGDAVRGPHLVVTAVRDGIQAAKAIGADLKGKS